MSLVAAALALLAVLPSGSPAATDDLHALVARTIEAHGGEAALRGAPALRQTGRVTSTIRRGEAGIMVRVFERPARLRVSIAYPGEPAETRVLDGETATRNGVPVSGPARLAMVLQAARLQIPQLLVEHRSRLQDLGTVEREGATRRVASLPLGEGLSLVVEIDPVTARVTRSTGRAPGGPPGGIEFTTEYDDYRMAGSVLLAFREKTFAMGSHTGDTVIDNVEWLSR